MCVGCVDIPDVHEVRTPSPGNAFQQQPEDAAGVKSKAHTTTEVGQTSTVRETFVAADVNPEGATASPPFQHRQEQWQYGMHPPSQGWGYTQQWPQQPPTPRSWNPHMQWTGGTSQQIHYESQSAEPQRWMPTSTTGFPAHPYPYQASDPRQFGLYPGPPQQPYPSPWHPNVRPGNMTPVQPEIPIREPTQDVIDTSHRPDRRKPESVCRSDRRS